MTAIRICALPMLTRRSPLFCERSLLHEIDSGGSFVARHKAFAEIPYEIVIGCFGVRPCNAAKAVGHPRFHLKSWERGNDFLHLVWWNDLILQADNIETDAGGS